MASRFDSMVYDEETFARCAFYLSKFKALESDIELLPDGRAKSLVFTRLEEAMQWLCQALCDEQQAREKHREGLKNG